MVNKCVPMTHRLSASVVSSPFSDLRRGGGSAQPRRCRGSHAPTAGSSNRATLLFAGVQLLRPNFQHLQVQQARVREETLAQQHETMLSKLETLKQNEKASHTKAQVAFEKIYIYLYLCTDTDD